MFNRLVPGAVKKTNYKTLFSTAIQPAYLSLLKNQLLIRESAVNREAVGKLIDAECNNPFSRPILENATQHVDQLTNNSHYSSLSSMQLMIDQSPLKFCYPSSICSTYVIVLLHELTDAVHHANKNLMVSQIDMQKIHNLMWIICDVSDKIKTSLLYTYDKPELTRLGLALYADFKRLELAAEKNLLDKNGLFILKVFNYLFETYPMEEFLNKTKSFLVQLGSYQSVGPHSIKHWLPETASWYKHSFVCHLNANNIKPEVVVSPARVHASPRLS